MTYVIAALLILSLFLGKKETPKPDPLANAIKQLQDNQRAILLILAEQTPHPELRENLHQRRRALPVHEPGP